MVLVELALNTIYLLGHLHSPPTLSALKTIIWLGLQEKEKKKEKEIEKKWEWGQEKKTRELKKKIKWAFQLVGRVKSKDRVSSGERERTKMKKVFRENQ